MGFFLTLAFLFFIGSCLGWVIELLFRRFISRSNPERKWINPGFCMGPYLPLYGVGLCVMFLIASLDDVIYVQNAVWSTVVLFLLMAVCMTVIEYIAGIISLKLAKVRLWDYTEEWGNIQGIICPKFSLIWAACGALYYFLIHPYILDALAWLSRNLAFSFVVGMFFGVFVIDVVYSANLIVKLKRFAEDNELILKYEQLKAHIRSVKDKNKEKYQFLLPFKTEQSLSKFLKEHISSIGTHRLGRSDKSNSSENK